MNDAANRPSIARPPQTLELLVLAILTDGTLHGYGLVSALRERSSGALHIRPGNLYRVLDRLTDGDGIMKRAAHVAPPCAPVINPFR